MTKNSREEFSARTGASLVWFRSDRRLADNPAVIRAAKRGGPVVPVFIGSDDGAARAQCPGEASRWWLHQSLRHLDDDLRRIGSRLIIRAGSPADTLRELAVETGADAVFWIRRFDPEGAVQDEKVKRALQGFGLTVEELDGGLFTPEHISKRDGGPYKIFTPFWEACLSLTGPPSPLPTPKRLAAPAIWPASLRLAQLDLEPPAARKAQLSEIWQPGERAAAAALKRFVESALLKYAEDRNRPDIEGTSRLSPYLHHGEISPRAVWHAVTKNTMKHTSDESKNGAERFLRELGWREFAYHLLHHFPYLTDSPLRKEFSDFPWKTDRGFLSSWQRGLTGYPFVDAGMRQLWATGWMHNRVRMVAASFLVKDLLIPWQEGEKWFRRTLVDADVAINAVNWQWVAGCGPDAAPFFRIFNPVRQGERFDPEGAYVRRWIPELGGLESKWIHKPWLAPRSVLDAARIRLGHHYPFPIVSHQITRRQAIEAFQRLKERRAGRRSTAARRR